MERHRLCALFQSGLAVPRRYGLLRVLQLDSELISHSPEPMLCTGSAIAGLKAVWRAAMIVATITCGRVGDERRRLIRT